MKTAFCIAALALGLALPSGASADGLLIAADHDLELRDERLRVVSVWVLAAPLTAGQTIPLASPLPAGTEFESADVALRPAASGPHELVVQRSRAAGAEIEATLLIPWGAALEASPLPIPSPRGDAIHRVRFDRSVRFDPTDEASLDVAAGIMVGRDVGRRERRRADRALDGPRAHRRMGALYVRAGQSGAASGALIAMKERRQHLALVAGLFCALLAAVVTSLYRRARRDVEREEVDAYLARTSTADEARSWGVAPGSPATPSCAPSAELRTSGQASSVASETGASPSTPYASG